MDEGESTSDDSNGVYPALVRSLTKMLKKAKEKMCNARCRHRAKEVNKQIVFNQKLKADKVTFEKDEQEKRSQIISEKRELAAKLEAVGEENEKLRRMGNEQKVGNEQLAKDLEELTRVHRTEVNKKPGESQFGPQGKTGEKDEGDQRVATRSDAGKERGTG